MKRTNIIIALLLAAFSTATLANNPARSEKKDKSTKLSVISKKDPTKFDLIYVSEVEGPVTVRIFNEEGDLVGFDQIKKRKSFIKTYNLQNLEAGKYIMKVENSEGVTEQEILYNPYKKSLNMLLTTKEFDKVKVTVIGHNNSRPVTLKIYDKEGQLLNSEVLEVQRGFSRTYDLSMINSNSIVVTATNGLESITKYTEIN